MTEPGNLEPQGHAEPNVARMYDHLLGGTDNSAIDREAADRVLEILPGILTGARENRAFLGRAVRFLVRDGVRQFIDIGAGLPTRRCVHEVAAEEAAGCRTVYVDNDPEVVSYARALLHGTPGVRFLHGDLHAPKEILGHPGVQEHLDLDQPVAVLLLTVVHVVADPRPIISDLMASLAPGSHLVLSHMSGSHMSGGVQPAVDEIYQGAPARPAQIADFFDGLELLPPGVVNLAEWRPESPQLVRAAGAAPYILCGVARKP
ncbi:SAM-dependent methyltransferase [Nonomuraea sp. ZG12]|uniref:SAM-dependent methyltransferase n=1 Tax=Nonomuraea sp. ZG12 TaxID=3452207 RepID=UPI003F8C0928